MNRGAKSGPGSKVEAQTSECERGGGAGEGDGWELAQTDRKSASKFRP